MRRLFLIALVALFACGTEASVESTTTAAPVTTTTIATTTTTTVPATTTTIDVMAGSGEYYLRIVEPGNCLVDQIVAFETSITSEDGYIYDDKWDEIQATLLPLYAEAAAADAKLVEDLSTYVWPEEVADDAARLASEVAASAQWALGFSEVANFEAWAEYPAAPPTPTASVVRAKLGLPTNIGMELCPESSVVSTSTTTTVAGG